MLYCLSLVHQLKGGENESSGADEDSAMGVGGGGASGSNNSNGGVGGIGQPIAAGAASASTVVGVNAPVTSAAPSTTTATSTAAAPTSASGAVAVVNHTISRGIYYDVFFDSSILVKFTFFVLTCSTCINSFCSCVALPLSHLAHAFFHFVFTFFSATTFQHFSPSLLANERIYFLYG